MLRIIGGEFRGRKLKVPAGKDVRPTSDRVREALFNLLSSMLSWEELTVIDLYAGSGALGLEALSRGAKNAIFVEASRKHMKILLQNVELMSSEQVTLILFFCLSLMRKGFLSEKVLCILETSPLVF